MNPEITPQEDISKAQGKHSVFTVTPLSKYLAMALFIIMPFIGGWIGYRSAPEKVVTVEDVSTVEKKKIEEYPKPSGKIYNLTEGFTGKTVTIDLSAERFLHFSDEYKMYKIWSNETVVDSDIPVISIVEIPYLQRKESYSNEELLNIVTKFSEASLTKRITGEEEVYDVKHYPEGVEFHIQNGRGYPSLFLWFDEGTETTLLIEGLNDDFYHSDVLLEIVDKISVTSSIEFFTEAESVTDVGNSMFLYENHNYGFSILYPDYVSLAEDIYDDDDDFTIAEFSPNNAGHFAFLKIYKGTTDAQSFEQYSEELISKLKQQDAEKLEDTVEVPFSLYNESEVRRKYSFSIEEIGNFKVLRYKRNFLNMAGDSNDMYVWLGNGLTLEFSSGYDDIDSVDDTYQSLKKI